MADPTHRIFFGDRQAIDVTLDDDELNKAREVLDARTGRLSVLDERGLRYEIAGSALVGFAELPQRAPVVEHVTVRAHIEHPPGGETLSFLDNDTPAEHVRNVLRLFKALRAKGHTLDETLTLLLEAGYELELG